MRRLRIAPEHMRQMAAHVAASSPLEACGLVAAGLVAASLGGAGDESSAHVFLIQNELASSTHYSMQPRQQLDAFMEMERQGWELLAIFHSHPSGPPAPSQTDIAEARYPGVAHLIWAPDAQGEWRCRAFLLDEGQVVELELT
ncbi:MAG: M67 family metallopeptidase [Anaerolineales bacterium]|nr:MAG: M67 family metallopeptidase [Anaerolineales bacterium]